jgi:hypothetical protein
MSLAAEFERFVSECVPFNEPKPAAPTPDDHRRKCLDWWFSLRTESPYLSTIATTLATIAPTSAAVERSFQVEGDAHRSDRPNLSPSNSEAECFIRMNYHTLSKAQTFDPDECKDIVEEHADEDEPVAVP